jgi:hypothetical protein
LPHTTTVDGDALAVSLEPPGPALPATATITVGGVTDLAGNELAGDDVFELDYPTWFQMTEGSVLGPNARFIDGAIAGDGTLHVLYGVPVGATFGPATLHVAAWSDAGWQLVGVPVATVEPRWWEAKLVLDASSNPIVVHDARDVRAWDGTGWTSYPSLPDPIQPNEWELHLAANGDLLVARCFDPTLYEVWLGGPAGWVGETYTVPDVSLCSFGVAPRDDGYVLAYKSGYDCLSGERDANGWLDHGVFHSGGTSDDACSDLHLANGGDGQVYLAYSHLDAATGLGAGEIEELAGGVWSPTAISGQRWVVSLSGSDDSIYAAVITPDDEIVIATSGGAAWDGLPAAFPVNEVLSWNGAPLVLLGDPVSSWGVFLIPNTF